MSAKTATENLSVDAVFESAQRAHAVILLLTEACSRPSCGDEIIYSLWAVEREIREIKEAAEAASLDVPLVNLTGQEIEGAA